MFSLEHLGSSLYFHVSKTILFPFIFLFMNKRTHQNFTCHLSAKTWQLSLNLCSIQALGYSTKAQTWLGLRFVLFQVRAAQVTRCLMSAVAPSWRLRLIASPVPATRFSGCTTGMPSQVCCVSLLGNWSLSATLLADVDYPESQEVLVSNDVSLQFGIGCLSGAGIAPFQLWLPSPACLRWGMGWSAAG